MSALLIHQLVALVASPLLGGVSSLAIDPLATPPHVLSGLAQDALATLRLIPAKPPIEVNKLTDDILTVVRTVLGAVGSIFFLIDMIRHLASSPRDLVAIGKDILAIVIIIAVAWKAEAIIAWAQTLF